MPASPPQNDWPVQTEAPSPRRPKRRRTTQTGATSKTARDVNQAEQRRTEVMSRDVVADQGAVATAKENCEVNSGNDVVSCYPTGKTLVAQHEWTTFVWNSNLPEFTQTERVNIGLFHGDSLEQILFYGDMVNPKGQAGYLNAPVNDSFWGTRGENYAGTNISYPYFWIISRSDKSFDDDSAIPQATFTAVQTTYADSVLAAMASTAAAAASATANPQTTGSTLSFKSSSTANVQSGASSNNFPHWAIAVIVVLGFLAMATTCILTFFILRRIRRRNAESNRNSMASSSPMMANAGNSAASPLLAGAAIPGRSMSHAQNAPSVVSPDGASTISRANSAGDGPFSGADAAIMADAFRKALRKPDFADRPMEEGESPDNPEGTEEELLNRELADEGKDIRSVGSSRGVKVETLSDAGTHDTAH